MGSFLIHILSSKLLHRDEIVLDQTLRTREIFCIFEKHK